MRKYSRKVRAPWAEVCVWVGWGGTTPDGGVTREENKQRKEWQKVRQQDWVEDGPGPSCTRLRRDGEEQ